MGLVEVIYDVTARYPDTERYGLVSQMRRCAVSIPSNIAEGAAKDSAADYSRCLVNSLGSVAELDAELEFPKRLGFLIKRNYKNIVTRLAAISRMLTALRRPIQKT